MKNLKSKIVNLKSKMKSKMESKIILKEAIDLGGTTLRDYLGSNGEKGYFVQSLEVYGREGESCRVCNADLKSIRLGQRATVYCPTCQR